MKRNLVANAPATVTKRKRNFVKYLHLDAQAMSVSSLRLLAKALRVVLDPRPDSVAVPLLDRYAGSAPPTAAMMSALRSDLDLLTPQEFNDAMDLLAPAIDAICQFAPHGSHAGRYIEVLRASDVGSFEYDVEQSRIFAQIREEDGNPKRVPNPFEMPDAVVRWSRFSIRDAFPLIDKIIEIGQRETGIEDLDELGATDHWAAEFASGICELADSMKARRQKEADYAS
jgi:hypothetical protein